MTFSASFWPALEDRDNTAHAHSGPLAASGAVGAVAQEEAEIGS